MKETILSRLKRLEQAIPRPSSGVFLIWPNKDEGFELNHDGDVLSTHPTLQEAKAAFDKFLRQHPRGKNEAVLIIDDL